MGASMAIVMFVFMRDMYSNQTLNASIITASIFLFMIALWLVRSQTTINDLAWLRGMIPHHSIAILTSERAHISDPRVRDLADRIINTQRKEIAEMELLIEDLKSK